MEPLVDLRALAVDAPHGRVVGPLDLRIEPGERVGLVGASGSGKTLTARSVLGHLPDGLVVRPEVPGGPTAGRTTGALFQDAALALDPLMRVGRQVSLVLRATGLSRRARAARVIAILTRLGLDPDVALARPMELSGGQRQRVALAMAMVREPSLLVADEPTSALDLVTQQSVLATMSDVVRADGAALLLISHDLALVADLCTRVVVMDAGQICEEGSPAELLKRPRHAATRRLSEAAVQLGRTA